MWSSTRVCKYHVFMTPLLDKSAGHSAHNTQEEAEKEDNVDANGNTRRIEGLIVKVCGRCGLGGA
jgi:hypothetical protein